MTDLEHQQNVEKQDAFLRNILSAATRVQDNPKEMMRATSSIHGHARSEMHTYSKNLDATPKFYEPPYKNSVATATWICASPR